MISTGTVIAAITAIAVCITAVFGALIAWRRYTKSQKSDTETQLFPVGEDESVTYLHVRRHSFPQPQPQPEPPQIISNTFGPIKH